MPLKSNPTDHLPYIDANPSDAALASANALIQEDLASSPPTGLHSSIPAFRNPQFSSLIDTEHALLDVGQPRLQGVDLSRYEALDAPETGDLEAWRTALNKAYASAEYLRGRETNLGLLESFGKNAWLIGNSQLEDLLRGLEVEVEAKKVEVENIERERRERQGMVDAEIKGLDKDWREGMGRLIEVLAAGEKVKQEILERRREGAR